MASNTSSAGNPLTTIFNPPAGCITNPTASSSTTFVPGSLCSGEYCYLGEPSCFPTGGATSTTYFDDQLVVQQYHYSPGVLPSHFTSVYSSATLKGVTEVWGCYS